MKKDNEDYSDYDRECYEEYLRNLEKDPEWKRIKEWDTAKYNPYASYMFASKAEKEGQVGEAGHYYLTAAELGCARAIWKVVESPSYQCGIRNMCVIFDRAIKHHQIRSDDSRAKAIRREAEKRAEDHPLLWTLLAYNDLCLGLEKEFESHCSKALAEGSAAARHMRASHLLRRARLSPDYESGRTLAEEALGLLEENESAMRESARMLAEELWTGRWTERDADRALVLFKSAAERSGKKERDAWIDYIWNPPVEEPRERRWDRIPEESERIGLYGCPDIKDTTEWTVLLRVTETEINGATRYHDHIGPLGGFDNEVFRINPFICEYSDGPDIPFLVFKPADVRLYRYDDPLMNADLDMYGLRMMLRACIDSVTGAARWIRTVSRPSAALTTSGTSPDGTNADTAGFCWTAAGTASSTTDRSTSGS